MTALETVADSKPEARCRAEARRYIKGEKAEDKQQQVPHRHPQETRMGSG
jgi:hypothetical protein